MIIFISHLLVTHISTLPPLLYNKKRVLNLLSNSLHFVIAERLEPRYCIEFYKKLYDGQLYVGLFWKIQLVYGADAISVKSINIKTN